MKQQEAFDLLSYCTARSIQYQQKYCMQIPSLISEFLAEAVYISVDPYMRAYARGLELGSTMIGGQVAKYVLA